jgi:hypothetical protein
MVMKGKSGEIYHQKGSIYTIKTKENLPSKSGFVFRGNNGRLYVKLYKCERECYANTIKGKNRF